MKKTPRYVLQEKQNQEALRIKLENSGMTVSSTGKPLTKKEQTIAKRVAAVPNYKPKQQPTA